MTSYTAKLVIEESFTFLTEARTVVLIMMNFVWCVFGRNFKSKKDLACKDYIQQPFPVSAIFNFHLRKWTAKPHLQKNQFTQPEILVLCNHSLTHKSMPLNSIPLLVQSKYSILQMKTQLQSKYVTIEWSEKVYQMRMLTWTSYPFQIIPLKTQLPSASLVTITLSII